MAILLSLVAAFSWGGGDYLGGVAAKRDDHFAVTIAREFVGLVVLLLVAVVVGGKLSAHDLALGLFGGVLIAITLPVFFDALSHGRMGIVAPVTGTVGASIPVVVGLLSGERPSAIQIVGILFAVLGIGLISSVKEVEDELTASKRSKSVVSDVLSAVVAGGGFGMMFVILHHTSEDSGLWPNVVIIATTTFLLITVRSAMRKQVIVKRENVPLNVIGGLMDLTAFLSFTYATHQGLLSITAIIASLYPAITALLAWRFQGETFDVAHKAGLGASIASLVLISAG